jgi:ribosomal-protein-alanine N-acetyltransferase
MRNHNRAGTDGWCMHTSRPVLSSERLLFRPFRVEDAGAVAGLAGAEEIARYALRVPHPYREDMACEWIATHEGGFERGDEVILAVTSKEDILIGAVGLEKINLEYSHAEIGYWIGVPFWNKGFGTEAVKTVVAYGFFTLGLHRIYAQIMSNNPGSAKVLTKCGFSREGTLRDHVRKQEKFVDIEVYGILHESNT